jgi:riboflavin synthase
MTNYISFKITQMFTGIISHRGKIAKIEPSSNNPNCIFFAVEVDNDFVKDLKIGDSIAHDGACLSVIELEANSFKLQLIPETIAKTNLKNKKIGDYVNLEKAMIVGSRLDGHIVQGHVDGVGTVSNYIQEPDNWVLQIKAPESLRKYIAYKGSISINGVSLTVSNKTKEGLEVSLIDLTLTKTNLGELKVGDLVNLEVDVIARYVENMICK